MKLHYFFFKFFSKFRRKINKILAAVIIKLFSKTTLLDKYKGYWLIGASGGRGYVDNSASLYLYILNNYPKVKIFWVINKKSKDVDKLKKISKGNILYKDTLISHIYARFAEAQIVTHGISDISGFKSKYLKNTLKVNLGHGVHGFKKRIDIPSSINEDYDLHIANSEFEKKIKESWGIESSKIVITGMPRYDDLIRKHNMIKNESQKKIFYMPTWRDWLVWNSNITQTNYYKEIKKLMTHPKLQKILEAQNIKLSLYLHINMENHFSKFKYINNNHILLLPPNADIQNEIVTSQLLITDYSSVAWDFLYLNKPVIFFHFDIEEYLDNRGAYIDLYNDLFGPVFYEAEDVLEIIEEYFNKSITLQNQNYDKWRERMFNYLDSKNCERVMDSIFQALRQKSKFE